MSYIGMKQKKLPLRYGRDMGMSRFEIIELVLLTLITIGLGVGIIAFIISALNSVKDLML